jgi:amino acid transporter
VVLIFSQINATVMEAYQFLVDMAVILYFIPFLYVYAAVIMLSNRPDRKTNEHAVLVPGGKAGVWICGILGFVVTLGAMGLAMVPPGGVKSKPIFEAKLVICTLVFIGIGLLLYWRGARSKMRPDDNPPGPQGPPMVGLPAGRTPPPSRPT